MCVWSLGALCASADPPAAQDDHDPAFDQIPFAQWITDRGPAAQIRWSAQVTPAQLSFDQRLVATITVHVDGAELAQRRGKGQFVVFTQLTDASGHAYQSHTAMDLTRVEEGLSSSNVDYPVRVFVLPGEYRVAVLLLDSATREHWSKTEKVQFGNLRHDPLPDSWRDLPPVAFASQGDPPESWLAPGSLHIEARTPGPAQIDVLVNLTPSERQSGSMRFRNQTLGALIPTLKVISEMRFSDATVNVKLLDLSRRRVVFHKDKVKNLNAEMMQGAFAETSTNTIDLKSLEDRGRNAAFFVKEVSKSLYSDTAPGKKHILVVLSASTAFDSGEDLRPIEASPDHCPVFYIRYQAPIVRRMMPYEGRRGWGDLRGMGPPGRRGPVDHLPIVDQLEKTLKPVNPILFDVSTPEQMRKAIAALRDQLTTL